MFTTNVKRTLIAVVFIALTISVFVSCEKTEQPPIDSKQNEVEKLRIAGIEHNTGLNFVLHKLKDAAHKKRSSFRNPEDLLSLVEKSTKTFLTENSKLIESHNRDYAIKCSDDAFVWIKETYLNQIEDNSTKVKPYYDAAYQSLNVRQKELLAAIIQAIDNENLDLQATLSAFENIRIRANNELKEEDRLPILSAIEIGSNSMIYWNENIDEWAALFSDGSKSTKGWFNWKKVAGADVKGAVTGATTGAITGAGAGVGALGGGVGASAGAAALELWNHWVN